MSTNKQLVIAKENAEAVLKEIQDAFYDIPFENSKFQTEYFVLASQVTPERVYRALGLSMYNKLITVQQALIQREMRDLEEEEILDKISKLDANSYEARKLKLDLKLKNVGKPFEDKLLNDAICELNILYSHFIKMPRYTREEFEAGEKQYHVEKSVRALSGI